MLFQSGQIGTMEVRNRIVMPAMATHLADPQGGITDSLISYYGARAKGGVGYITVEHTCVHPSGRAHGKMVCLHNDHYIEGFKKLAEVVHNLGSKIVVQLNHAGRQTLSSVTGQQILSASAIPCPLMKEVPRALSRDEIRTLVDSFSEAALRVKRAGCDGVEFQMGHGYLICQFLSPYSNRRPDEYGGPTTNRTRFALEIIENTRKKVGDQFPLICRISGDEMVDGGLNLKETQAISRELVTAGIHAIHVSACNYESYAFNMPCYYLSEGCFTHLAEGIKAVVNVPVIAVGRIRTPAFAEEILREGKADLVAMGRALIADPNLPEKAERGAFREIRPCLSCNKCVESISKDRLECTVNPDIGVEGKLERSPKGTAKKIFVIGGGPGGMQAAKVALEMGHQVTLYEAGAELGGQLKSASLPPMKGAFGELRDYFETALAARGVTLKLNTECTSATVERERPDAIIAANGPKSPKPAGPRVMDSHEALNHPQGVGNKILVIGGGPRGAEVAHYFSSRGKQVTIVEMGNKIGLGLPTSLRFHLEKKLRESHVQFLTRTKLLFFTEGGIRVSCKGVESELNGFDAVILATGEEQNRGLAKELEKLHIPLFLIGDAKEPRGIKEAIADASRVAMEL
jgi:2,4-dienoyl-CoA reductase-like NADH-dependent reductase (Old Yellow Enzyme family)/thioredoxin reductase